MRMPAGSAAAEEPPAPLPPAPLLPAPLPPAPLEPAASVEEGWERQEASCRAPEHRLRDWRWERAAVAASA